MKKVLQQTQPVSSVEEAEDMLAGWRGIPGFVYAYATCSTAAQGDTPDTLVGLFEVNGDVKRGPRQHVAYVQ